MYDKNAFLLERYKYILLRKQSLNDATFKIAATYQTMVFALAIAQYNVVSAYHIKSISQNIALTSTYALMLIFTAATLLILCLIAGGVNAWFKYRKEENEIDQEATNKTRPPPSYKNIFSWYESYIFIIVSLVGFFGLVIYFNSIIPAIKSV